MRGCNCTATFKIFANKVHIQGKTVLLADKMHKQSVLVDMYSNIIEHVYTVSSAHADLW